MPWKTILFKFDYGGQYNVEGTSGDVILDVDGDGDLDIITPGYKFQSPHANPLRISLNDGRGRFKEATEKILGDSIPKTTMAHDSIVADFNGDGRDDAFLADNGMDDVPFPGAPNTLLLSSGAHDFRNATERLPGVSDYTHSATAGDIDSDGDLDILVQNLGLGTPPTGPITAPYFLINDGAAHFTRADDLLPQSIRDRETNRLATTSTIFDANNDGHADIFFGTQLTNADVVPNPASFVSYVLLNDGHGDFSTSAPIPTPKLPLKVNGAVLDAESLDINGDGNADLALAIGNDYVQDYIQFLIGDGTGRFLDETSQRFPHLASDNRHKINNLHPADFNNDGYVDFVDRAPFLINDGTGHFIRLPNSFPSSSGAYDVRVRDFNNDGRLDVLDMLDGDGGKFEYALHIQTDPGNRPKGTKAADGLIGDKTNEKFKGLGGKDVIFGGLGKDTVSGGDGKDYLNGGDGNDTIKGDAGGDALVGALGSDKLAGGPGKDIFKFNAIAESLAGEQRDTILDFKGDRIDLSFIDANSVVAGDQALVYITAQAFSDYVGAHPGARGLARFDKGLFQVDIDGNGVADLEVTVRGDVSAGNLIL